MGIQDAVVVIWPKFYGEYMVLEACTLTDMPFILIFPSQADVRDPQLMHAGHKHAVC